MRQTDIDTLCASTAEIFARLAPEWAQGCEGYIRLTAEYVEAGGRVFEVSARVWYTVSEVVIYAECIGVYETGRIVEITGLDQLEIYDITDADDELDAARGLDTAALQSSILAEIQKLKKS